MNAQGSAQELPIDAEVEANIVQWKAFLTKRSTISAEDSDDLEEHLRDSMETLQGNGLTPGESFLIAIQRMGSQDRIAREFALVHSERLWKHLVLSNSDEAGGNRRNTVWGMLIAALLTGLAFRLCVNPALADRYNSGVESDWFTMRLAPLVAIMGLTLFVGWLKRLRWWGVEVAIPLFVGTTLSALFIVKDVKAPSAGIALAAAILVMWCGVGVVYSGKHWRSVEQRLNFIRFTGEFVIYFALLMAGNGLVTLLGSYLFDSVGIDAEVVMYHWWAILFSSGGIVVAAWLVEAKKSVIENMAPVLARLFAPIVALLLVVIVGVLIWTMNPLRADRGVLFGYTAVLIVAFALVLYSFSARAQDAKAQKFDWVYLILLVTALGLNVYMLTTMASRISEFGLSPNKLVMLGLNVLLAVNLAWAARRYLLFLRGTEGFNGSLAWQAKYLTVFAGYALVLVLVFPLLTDYSWALNPFR